LAAYVRPHVKAGALVLAVPRGGVVVGAVVAEAIEADLDVIIVRKLGAPHNPELAIGSIIEGGEKPYLNTHIISQLGVGQEYIRRETEAQLREAARRADRYRQGASRPTISGRTVVLVDDGVATGATMISSIHGVRMENPSRLLAALPVGPADTIDEIARLVDDVYCLATPPFFGAVGQFYRDFGQTSDEEVVQILQRFRKTRTRQRD